MTRRLMQGSEAIAEAAIAAGCRFFAGYPMLPFTGLLENMAAQAAGRRWRVHQRRQRDRRRQHGPRRRGHRRPRRDRIVRPGHRAHAGGDRRGCAQRAAGRDLQHGARASRTTSRRRAAAGGATTARSRWRREDVPEAVEHTQLLFHLADRYRTPVILYGDYAHRPRLRRHRGRTDRVPHRRRRRTGRSTAPRGGTGRSRQIWTWAMGKPNTPGPGPSASLDEHRRQVRRGRRRRGPLRVQAGRRRRDRSSCRSARPRRSSITSSTSCAPKALRVGSFRPVTLWPFPGDALAEATRGCAAGARLRAQRRADDRRRAHVRARPRGRALDRWRVSRTTRACVRARCSTPRSSAAASSTRSGCRKEHDDRHSSSRSFKPPLLQTTRARALPGLRSPPGRRARCSR